MRFVLAMGLLAIGAGVVVFETSGTAADEKKMSIGECMKCQNKVRGAIGKAAEAGKWEDAVSNAKTWKKAAADLASGKPGKGDEKSWKSLTDKYTSTVNAVAEACDKKDAAEVKKKLGEFGSSCKSCHDAHKGK